MLGFDLHFVAEEFAVAAKLQFGFEMGRAGEAEEDEPEEKSEGEGVAEYFEGLIHDGASIVHSMGLRQPRRDDGEEGGYDRAARGGIDFLWAKSLETGGLAGPGRRIGYLSIFNIQY